MKKFVLCFLMLMASSGVLWAEAVSFESTVNSPRVSLDEVMQLTLSITGVNDNLDPVSLPVLDGFTAKYLGPSTNVSIINGVYHSERAFVYNLFPNKVGKFQIPAITATIAGQTYATKPIDVEVTESSAQAQAPSGPSTQNQAPSAESLKDKILVIASVDKKDVYLNECVPLRIKLLVNGVPIRDIQYPQFEKQGFLVDDFDKPQQSSGVFNGVRYDTVEFKINVYPNRLGDLTLGPVQIQGNVVYKTGQSNPFNQDSSFLGADVFSNFFDSYAARPVTVSSDPIVLHVSTLPSENRPIDFSGAIGQSFDFQASVSPLQVRVGDPLTLKMELKGIGNFKNLKIPVFQAPGFKSYEPKIKGTPDDKTAEEVIIPTLTEIREVPALHFSYFDTSLKDYKTITQGPFPIQVTAPSPDQEFKAVGFSNLNPVPATVSANQFSFGKMFKKIHHLIKKLCGSIWFWVSLGIVLVAGVSFFLWRRFQERLQNDPAFARRLKAVKEAKQALSQAKGYIAKARVKDFYALLSKVLRDYLANKWHQPAAALSVDEILAKLKAAKVDEKHISQLKFILEQSDLVCFAGANRDTAGMQADLSQTQDIITHLEKSLK